MTHSELIQLSDGLKAEKVARGSADNLSTYKEAMQEAAKFLVLSSDGTTKPYSTGNWWTKVSDKMTEYGQVYGVDSDEQAIQDLAAELSYPAAYPNAAALVAFITIDWAIVFVKVGDEYPAKVIIAESEITNNTVESAPIIIPTGAEVLILALKASGIGESESLTLKYETSIDSVQFCNPVELSKGEDGTKIIYFEIKTRAKYVKFTLVTVGTVTASLKGKVI